MMSNGKHNGKTVYCPIDDYDCPFCGRDGVCHKSNPVKSCDTFWAHFKTWEAWERFEAYIDEFFVKPIKSNEKEGF